MIYKPGDTIVVCKLRYGCSEEFPNCKDQVGVIDALSDVEVRVIFKESQCNHDCWLPIECIALSRTKKELI